MLNISKIFLHMDLIREPVCKISGLALSRILRVNVVSWACSSLEGSIKSQVEKNQANTSSSINSINVK